MSDTEQQTPVKAAEQNEEPTALKVEEEGNEEIVESKL